MKCELCNTDHDGLFESGRFCSLKCRCTFSSRKNKEQQKRKVKETFKLKYFTQWCVKELPKVYPTKVDDGIVKIISRYVDTSNGYVKLYLSDKSVIEEHRYVMEQHLGRELETTEVVHHINENKLDNRLENLEVLDSREHVRLHFKDSKKFNIVKEQYKLGKSGYAISKEFNLNRGTVYNYIKLINEDHSPTVGSESPIESSGENS